MDDLPDATTIRRHAAEEALERLGLLKPLAAPTIMALLDNVAGEHPRSACAAYRGGGDQISADAKRQLGLRASANLSLQALEELSDRGRANPLRAHELTLIRASFVLSRYRSAVSYARVMGRRPEVRMVVRYDAFHHDSCDVCKALHDTPVASDWALFAPGGCICMTAPYALRLDADWRGTARHPGPRKPDRPKHAFLDKVLALFARS